MRNRIYTFCNGNDVVNDLKEIPANAAGKTKFAGCNTCHPGNHLSDVGSTGPAAEQAIDCLICHSSHYDYSKRKPYKTAGREGGDRAGPQRRGGAGGGQAEREELHDLPRVGWRRPLIKRGFAFDAEHDVHAAKEMACVDCHEAKNHRVPTGFDPNNWANDGVRLSCVGCHGRRSRTTTPSTTLTRRRSRARRATS